METQGRVPRMSRFDQSLRRSFQSLSLAYATERHHVELGTLLRTHIHQQPRLRYRQHGRASKPSSRPHQTTQEFSLQSAHEIVANYLHDVNEPPRTEGWGLDWTLRLAFPGCRAACSLAMNSSHPDTSLKEHKAIFWLANRGGSLERAQILGASPI